MKPIESAPPAAGSRNYPQRDSPAEALLFGSIQFLVCKRRFNVSEQYREDDCERDEGSV